MTVPFPITLQLAPEAIAPKRFIEIEYTPVMIPIYLGYSRLMRPGSNTLQTAIANPSKAVPTYKLAIPEKDRKRIPMVKVMIAIKRRSSTPNLCPNFGTEGEKKAKESRG